MLFNNESIKDKPKLMRCTIADKDKVNRIMSHDDNYPISHNGELCPDDLRGSLCDDVLRCDSVYVLSPDEHSVFIFAPYSQHVYYGHLAILKEGRGKIGIQSGKEVLKWLFANTGCKKVIGLTPVTNRAALIFHRMCGLKKYGVLPKSHMESGEMIDMVILGIDK